MRRIPPGMKSPGLLMVMLTVLNCTVSLADETKPAADAMSRMDRTLIKEPKYESAPKYALMVLGITAETRVWMVEDGRRLFVDRNANGDLTDDGPPIEPSDFRQLAALSWDFNYVLDAITPADGSRHTQFYLIRWNYGDKEDSYGLSINVDEKRPMYAGWFGTFWSAQREKTPVIRLGGSFVPRLLRDRTFSIGAGPQRLSLGFINPGSGEGAQSRLSIDALPMDVVPVVHVEWPVAEGAPPLRTTHPLNERCCYWDYYTTKFEVPKGAAVGKAKATVEIPVVTPPIVLKSPAFEVGVTAAMNEPGAAK